MKLRPTEEDIDALDILLSIDRIDEKSALFLESLYEKSEHSEGIVWSEKQCKWFDDLCERYI